MLSSKNLPLVSIITVVYNAESLIETTIQSVLGQTYPNIEHWIIDGASTDHTLEIIKKYSEAIKVVSEFDSGIYDAMNKGLRLATGEWVHFLNAGDEFVDSNVLVNLFSNVNSVSFDFIYGDSINVINDRRRYINATIISKKSLLRGMGVCHQSVFIRKTIAPNYDTSYRLNADYNWIIDIFDRTTTERTRHVPIPIVFYKLGGVSEKKPFLNLKEFILITVRRFGLLQMAVNSPIYLKVLLRLLKNKLIGYDKWFL